MLRSLKSLQSHKLAANDGDIGTVHDFFFDDEVWRIRYLVADTGHWLPGRRVLISPAAVGPLNHNDARVPVNLTRKQVEASPEMDNEMPVSRQREIELHRHYGWPTYWGGSGIWPDPLTPMAPVIVPMDLEPDEKMEEGDPHLRSMREVMGYHIKATDGSIGHAEDLIVDLDSWEIRYMVVDTRNWLPGKKVLISPQWMVGRISWLDKTVNVFMTQENVRNSPVFEPNAPVNREYEEELYDYYGRPGYWKQPPNATDPRK